MPCWTEETAYHATHNRDVRWHHALRQLDGLREFAILGGPVLDLPVQSLPASLKVLKGSYLNIDHSTAAATASAHASRASSSQASPGQSESECVADARPKLYELDLRWCQLSSPSILASNQLLQLNLDSNTWSGGWAAAGAAWPCFKKLTWYSSGEFDTTSRHTSANQQAATILRSMLSSLGSSNCDLLNLSGETLSTAAIARWFSKSVTVEDPSFKDIALAFPHLTDLKVENLPWMTVDLLQPVLHYMKDLQQVSLNISGRGVRIQLDTYRLVLLRDRTNSKTTSRLLKHPDIALVEQKLAEVFPWARVFVE